VSGRVALVTGAGRGIGRAIALALSRAGHTVAVTDLLDAEAAAVAEEISAGGCDALALALDVSDSDAVTRAAQRVERELGPVEVLVNNAGWDEFHPFVETDEGFWARVIDVNFVGCLRTTRAVLPGMAERGFGRLVNVASDAARVGSANEAVYAGAKAAVIAFTKTIARETARRGVTANVVCPGPTDTPLLRGMAAGAPDADRLVEALVRAVPMRRLGQPEDVAAAVAFLASEEAGFVTGQTLSVSGGLTMA
jgi:2-hydroxycyclohexanecarboxyl-CoA dehydrogenase